MIREYIQYISSIKGYSSLTCKAYEKDLYHFCKWIKSTKQNARWSTISRDIIDEYITDAERNEQSASTTNRRLSAISGLYNYMKRQGYKVENPCKYESRRKIAQRIPNTISEEELLSAYNESCGTIRVMLGLLITTGIRISELLQLRLSDVDTDNNTIRVKGKGDKERIIKVPAMQLAEIKRVKEHNCSDMQLFQYQDRKARKMIHDALKPYCRAKQLSPHAIRHTFATNLAIKGENVITIAGILGHQHIETTQKYIDMAAAINRAANITNSII